MLYVLFGILAGNALPLQTSVNAALRRQLKNPLLASLISFSCTVATFCAVLLATEGKLSLPLGALIGEPFWVWLPGLLGVLFLVGNILLYPRLGSVRTIICTATGQVLMALLIDAFALFGARARAVGALRLIGAALAMSGVAVVAVSRGEQAHRSLRSVDWLWCAVGVAIGMGNVIQTTINAHVATLMNSQVKAAAVSPMQSVPLVLALMLLLRRKAPISLSGFRGTKPWMWIGGSLGSLILFVNAWLTGRIGAGVTVVTILVGSTLGGVVIDSAGLLGGERQRVTARTVLGIALMLCGAALIRLIE